MKWSFKIGKLAGITVYVHWTFIFFLVWIGLRNLVDSGADATLRDLFFITMIFSFIVLHELGHALTARHFGIRTRDITLLPIGGVARLERMPENPHEELLVAIAGPAVNFAITAIAAAIIAVWKGLDDLMRIEKIGTDFLITAFYINIGIGTFNLLPAFPMDGGRILRALLVKKMGYVSATEAAASIGQFIAIVLGILGLFTHGMLIFVALFVYLGAHQEALQVQMKSVLKGVPVFAAMRTHFTKLLRSDELAVALKEVLAGNQYDFPVVDDNDALCGMIYRENILSHLGDESDVVLIDELMQPDCGSVSVNEMLDKAFAAMNDRNCSVLPVIQSGQVVGLISLENIGAFMMIQSARSPYRRSLPGTSSFKLFENQCPAGVRKEYNAKATTIH